MSHSGRSVVLVGIVSRRSCEEIAVLLLAVKATGSSGGVRPLTSGHLDLKEGKSMVVVRVAASCVNLRVRGIAGGN